MFRKQQRRRRRYIKIFNRFSKKAAKLRKVFLRVFGANWHKKPNPQLAKYAGDMTTNKYTAKYNNLAVYNKRSDIVKTPVEGYIHSLYSKNVASLLHLPTTNYTVVGSSQAFLHMGATHLGTHLSTLYLFCKNFMRLHDVEAYPVLCLVNSSNWAQSQTSTLAVEPRRSRTKFLGNLVTRGRKETILRAYGSSMMHVWNFTQQKHNFSAARISNIAALLRTRHLYLFKPDSLVGAISTLRIFYLYSLGLQKQSNVFELATRLNTNFFNRKMSNYLFLLFSKIHKILLSSNAQASHPTNTPAQISRPRTRLGRACCRTRTFFETSTPLSSNFGPRKRLQTFQRIRNYYFFNNLQLSGTDSLELTKAGPCYTNCDFFYKLIYVNCPIMLYTIKKKDKWRYKHGHRGESKYTFNLQHLNPDERIYYALRYSRYIFLFNKQRTINLRMFSYLFELFMCPSRMLLNRMGFRATIQARYTTSNYL